MQYLNNVFTVDPGEYTAIAYWTGNTLPSVNQFKLHDYSISSINKAWNDFTKIIKLFPNSKVYLEGTKLYIGNLISNTAARRGDLFKLCGLTYGYCAICNQYDIKWEIIPPYEWKGQMSKEATAERVRQINGQIYSSEHITDAVGLGFGIMSMLTWRREK